MTVQRRWGAGRSAEALRELQRLSESREVALAVTLAMIHAHKQASDPDREAVKQLENKFKNQIKECTESALYHGALVMWFIGKHDKGRDLADRRLKMQPESVE
jgi:hypothetical protein